MLNSPVKRMQVNLTSKAKTNIITLVGAAFLIGVGLAAILVWTGVLERQTNSEPVTAARVTPPRVTPPRVTPPALDPSTFEWYDVASWDSSGDDDSPPFHIEAEFWRVMWVAPHDSVGDGSFAVAVYNADGTYYSDLYDTADSIGMKFDGPLSGTLAVPGAGGYFLRLTTARDYEVTVQEAR